MVEVQENNLEKIELWARGESLISNENTQVFLNTECNVLLYFIEKFSLKLVICNASDEESNEKSLRVDIVLDEAAAGLLLRVHEIPVIYKVEIVFTSYGSNLCSQLSLSSQMTAAFLHFYSIEKEEVRQKPIAA